MDIDNFHIGAAKVLLNDVEIGATTQEGVVVSFEPDIHLHTSGKYGSTPVKASLIGQRLNIQMTIAETTPGIMAQLFGGVVSADGKIKFGGVAGREIAGGVLKLQPYDDTEEWVFRNAVPNSNVQVLYQPNNERVYQVSMTALVDDDMPEAENVGYVS